MYPGCVSFASCSDSTSSPSASSVARLTDASTDTRIRVYDSVEDFASLEPAWNELALGARNPFVTHQWLSAWSRAFGGEATIVTAVEDADGALRAGAGLLRRSRRDLSAAANVYSDDWDVVAVDDSARERLWRGIAALPAVRLTLPAVPATSPTVAIAASVLSECGYRVAVSSQQLSPFLELPGSMDELLATMRRKKRSQIRALRRRLEGEGQLVFRTTTGPGLEADLERFLRLEASGWKGAAGTAILNDPAAQQLYTEFAHAAARAGWLRLHLLELDGVTIAGDYSCVLGDAEFLLKTCFDERYKHLSPGTALRTEVLRAAIEDRLGVYEFLGGPEPYKLQWGGDVRERVLLRAYRGSGLPEFVYRHRLRPLARRLLR